MDPEDENLTSFELLETAERLFSSGGENRNMFRAAVLEAITALESIVRDNAFPALEARVGKELCDWLEEKTRMDFQTRLGLFIPLATGLRVDKTANLWQDFKKAKDIRNKVTHSGRRVTRREARLVIDTVYEWVEYLTQAEQTQVLAGKGGTTPVDTLGRFIQASARLERVVYTAATLNDGEEERLRKKVLPLEDLRRLSLIDDPVLHELQRLRSLRNRAIHAEPGEEIGITENDVNRLNQIVDEIQAKLGSTMHRDVARRKPKG